MLFLETKALNYTVDGNSRIRLLQELQDEGLTPLIRTTRLRFFEDVLLSVDRISELESALSSAQSTIDEPFVRGDLFCFDDHLLFIVFDDDSAENVVRAGISLVPEGRQLFPSLSVWDNLALGRYARVVRRLRGRARGWLCRRGRGSGSVVARPWEGLRHA